MATSAKTIIPVLATHPGSVLKSELKARGIRQKDFAAAIGMPEPNLSEIVKGKRHITEAIAIKLEDALGIPFETWMQLQSRYHYVVKRRAEIDTEEAAAAREEELLVGYVNLRAIYDYLGVRESTAVARIARLKGISSFDFAGLGNIGDNTVGFLKRSDRLKVDERNMRTWLLLARLDVVNADVFAAYTPENGLLAANEIAEAAHREALTTASIKEILNRRGIIFRHVPTLDNAPIDAFSTMAGSHPAIVVTCRRNDLDKLVFDVLHEIGHILRHLTSGKSFISVENEDYSRSAEEKDADEFAENTLIAPAVWKSILSAEPASLSPNAVTKAIAVEAQKHGVSPTIAVARYRHASRCCNVRGYRSPSIS